MVDSYVLWPEKSIPKVNFSLGGTYDVINDDSVILRHTRELKMTIDYIATLMFVIDFYDFWYENSILTVCFSLGVTYDVINDNGVILR